MRCNSFLSNCLSVCVALLYSVSTGCLAASLMILALISQLSNDDLASVGNGQYIGGSSVASKQYIHSQTTDLKWKSEHFLW